METIDRIVVRNLRDRIQEVLDKEKQFINISCAGDYSIHVGNATFTESNITLKVEVIGEKMESLDQRDWQAKIPDTAGNTISCVECKKQYEEKDMKKIFARGEGICKECWNFEEEI
jgi:hypothetical protein